ncbi:helix-turn-helix domain-containing protein [Olivibacter sp. CPCC 100613]|uniref:helix-turn-helix domain-containing protein n=1 Tax=Olivibacter sp. CPCC 100613 TaxID=3079931 RepID=UPI002FFD54FC
MSNFSHKLIIAEKNDAASHSMMDGNPDFIVMQADRNTLTNLSNLHLYEYMAFILNLKGEGIVNMEKYSFKLAPGRLYLIKLTSATLFESLTSDFQSYVILFKKDFIINAVFHEPLIENLLVNGFDEPAICTLTKSNFASIQLTFKRLDQEYHNSKLFRDKMLRLLFIELLLETSRTSTQVSVKALTLPSRQQQLVNKFKRLIDDHFLTKRTVQEYAEHLFVTAKHLSEVVKVYTGTTALYMIHSRIIEEAKYWLTTSNLSIKEIAGKLNFDTSSHFSRFFKHIAGYNPTAFQRLYSLQYVR